MKLSVLLLFIGILSARGAAFSQKITISGRNMRLENVLNEIERQSGYQFWYEAGMLNNTSAIDINVKNMPLEEVLDKSLRSQHIRWKIVKQTIILTKEKNAVQEAALPAQLIAGVVVDGLSFMPLPGASIRLKSNNKYCVTDAEGHFAVPTDLQADQLQVTFIGYQPLSVHWAAGDKLRIRLFPAPAKLNETVITGYSEKKVGELTGAIQKISGDALRRGITTSDPVSLLKGWATGLYISEQQAGDPTSSGGQIFVRGQSSIVGVGVDQANEFVMPRQNYGPLLVLDGVIMPNQNLKEIVTPQEIQDITILKDAAATAIYGSRAAAGVLVVNTKRGKLGKTRLNAEVKYGLNHPTRGPVRFLNAQELNDLQKTYYTDNYKINNAALSPTYPTLQAYLDNRLPSAEELAHPYNWEKYGFLNSNTKEVNVNASGGNERTRFYTGASYYNEQSTAVLNGLKRMSFRLNLDTRLTDRLTSSIAINAIINDGRQQYSSTGTFLYSLVPWANPYNADGTIRSSLQYKMNGSQQQDENPLFDDQYNYVNLGSQLLFGSAKLDYKITDWLSLSSTNSGNLNYNKTERYMDARSFAGSGYFYSPKGYLGTTTSYLSSYLTSNQLNFHKTYGEHSIRALAAMEFGLTHMEDIRVNVNNVRAGYPVISLGRLVGPSYDYSAYGIYATKAGNVEGGKEERGVYSLFGEAGYTYRSRYSLNASLRRDASSSFGRDNRYGTFYSLGGAWVLSSEPFIQKQTWLSNLKLRVNYGTNGSQLGDNFLTNTLYQPGRTYAGQTGAVIAVLGNPDLRWEVTKTLSSGIDLGLFDRVTASVDYYRRRSDDLLQKVALHSLAGFESQWQNVASVQNRGIEILINSDNIVRKNFRWNMSFNVTFNKNKILRVANDSLRQGFYTSNSFYLFAGDDINTLKAVKYAGVDAQTGQPLFEKLLFDAKGNVTGKELVHTTEEVDAGTDTRQFQTIGSFQPKYYGGWNNSFSYKQFTLSALVTFAVKYIMVDGLAEQMQGSYLTSYNQLAYRKSQRVWTTPGQTDATEPSVYYQANTTWGGTSKYMHDGTHARLRSVRLSYDLPAPLLARLRLANCQVYVSGDNLYTWYSKNIISTDPEGPSVGQAQDFGGSVGSSVGAPRRYVFGLQVGF